MRPVPSAVPRQPSLPLEILSAPLGHFTAHIVQRIGIEDLFREREDFVVFNSNVAFVDGLKLVEIVAQARCFVMREPSICQPLLTKLLDGVVAALRDFVIGFQR